MSEWMAIAMSPQRLLNAGERNLDPATSKGELI